MFERGGLADERGVVLLDGLPAWAQLPEDAGRHCPPDDGLIDLEEMADWDAWEGDLPAEPGTGDPLDPPTDLRPDSHATLPDDEHALDGSQARWESAAGLERVAPGPELAMVLDVLDLARADDLTAVEVVAAWERLAAWAHLGAMLAAADLSRRTSMNPAWDAPVPAHACVAADELAMRLAWSRRAAERLVRDGRALEHQLVLTADAVRAGALDTPKLRTLTDRLHDRAGELAWAVQEEVLPSAGSRTPRQLADDVDRALLTVAASILFIVAFDYGMGNLTDLIFRQREPLWVEPELLVDPMAWPLQLGTWLAVGYCGVVRFLSYIDQRIRLEGWELELRMKALGASMEDDDRW